MRKGLRRNFELKVLSENPITDRFERHDPATIVCRFSGKGNILLVGQQKLNLRIFQNNCDAVFRER